MMSLAFEGLLSGIIAQLNSWVHYGTENPIDVEISKASS